MHIFLISYSIHQRTFVMRRGTQMNTNVGNNKLIKKPWPTGLVASMKDPELKVKEDDKVVVIKDKYPKAQFHYLVLPREDIPTIWNVTKDHEELLFHMDRVAEDLAKEHPDHEFKIGYHAMPSMYRLHLHVISTDFVSDRLKTKVHWNSFTTPFLLNSKDICKTLKEKGKLTMMSTEECNMYLKGTELQCHKCFVKPKNMPELRRHLLTHVKNK